MKFKKPNKGRRPFRFLVVWLTHKDFPKMLEVAWPTNSIWCSQVKLIQGTLCDWKRRVFGNIFERAKALIRGLGDLDKILIASPLVILEAEQNNLWLEYKRVLAQEELLWYQKS